MVMRKKAKTWAVIPGGQWDIVPPPNIEKKSRAMGQGVMKAWLMIAFLNRKKTITHKRYSRQHSELSKDGDHGGMEYIPQPNYLVLGRTLFGLPVLGQKLSYSPIFVSARFSPLPITWLMGTEYLLTCKIRNIFWCMCEYQTTLKWLNSVGNDFQARFSHTLINVHVW